MTELYNGPLDKLVFIVEDGKELSYDNFNLWYLHELWHDDDSPDIKIMINKDMKLFKDLNFEPHPNGHTGLAARLFFENGYGVYVVRFKALFGGGYGSYTENENQWELAVLKGNNENSEPCYDTPITNDVLGYLTEEDVNTIMKDIQKLPPCE